MKLKEMTFNVLTIFPRIFDGFLNETMMKRAVAADVVNVRLVNIRDYATGKHRTTDDTPYGGGPGMVMNIEPIYQALRALRGEVRKKKKVARERTILLAARGKQFDQKKAREFAKLDQLTLICGRYEGVDQRVADHLCDEELSIGPYVLSGGEVASMVVIESVARLLPGFLGNVESLKKESFSLETGDLKLDTGVEYPQYTRPADFRGWKVPPVLLSGNHRKIEDWRAKQSRRRT